VAQDEPHVSVGGPLAAEQSGKKDDHGEIKREKSEATSRRKRSMHACKKACTRKATTGWRKNMRTWEEDLTSVGLVFW
jgi:hypothetical protein